jgi:hypothetical protein
MITIFLIFEAHLGVLIASLRTLTAFLLLDLCNFVEKAFLSSGDV